MSTQDEDIVAEYEELAAAHGDESVMQADAPDAEDEDLDDEEAEEDEED
ncbi:MAG: hypothetical protein ACK5XZ_15025 [Hyphomonadaceae bacterium]|jgi:hypothetical protein|nr:hypothetical protein [Aquidulcibacter sp.]MCE2891159.1 hypothetical protein [Hyphomonadaceae bacterium]MCZ8208487.1 hypothetical protein [Aquidulcibacter sp.]